MTEATGWRVDVLVDDVPTGTRARTRLRTPDGTTLVGVGEAPRGPDGTGDALAVSHALSDLTGQLSAAAGAGRARPVLRRWLAELAGYAGGGLMLGGAALLVATSWADLTRPGRITLLGVTTAALLAAGVLAAGGPRPRSRPSGVRFRLAGVLLALGACATALTAGTIAGSHEAFWAAAAGFVVAALGWLVVRSVSGVLVSAAFSAMAVGVFVGEVLDAGAVALGVSLVVLGLAWHALDMWGALAPPSAGFTLGAAIALIGAQQPLGEPGHAGWAYGLTFCVAVVWLVNYFWHRTPVLLVAGIAGLTIAVPEAIWDWTDGAVGGALVAVIAGAVLLTASWAGLRVGGPRQRDDRIAGGGP